MTPTQFHPGALETAIKLYVRDDLCGRRGWNPRDCHLEIPLEGRRSMVRFAVGPDENRVALRLYLRPREVRDWDEVRHAAELLHELGIATPRHLHVAANFGGRGAVLVEEEFIPGETLAEVEKTPAVIDALAETLGRLHSRRSALWGQPRWVRRRGFARAMIRRLGNRLHGLARAGHHTPLHRERRAVWRWARRWRPIFAGFNEYSLTHDKLNPGNVMITPAPRAVLLDVNTVRWGSAAKDLTQLRAEAFGEDSGGWDRFTKAHRRIVGDEVAEEIEQVEPFFEVYHHIAECAIAASRLRRAETGRGVGRVSRAPEKIERHWADALHVIAEHSAR